jgi:hypothetical protein
MARVEASMWLRLDLRPTIEGLRAAADALEKAQEQFPWSFVEPDEGQEEGE